MSTVGHKVFYYTTFQHATLLLAFVGGFVDAAGYIKFFELFTSSITGNLISASTALLKRKEGVFASVFITLAFALGAFVTSALYIRLRFVKKINLWTTAIVLFLGESVALLLSLAIGVYIESSPMTYKSIESWQTILVASLMALSMGIHNSAALSTIPNVLSTTAMTVTIIKTSVFAAQALEFYFMHANMLVLHPAMSYVVVEERLSENFKKFRDHAVVIVAFVGGAITGAALVLQIQLWCLAVPIVAILLLVVDIYFAKRSADAELNAVDTSGSVEELEHDGEATEPQAEQQEEVTVTDGVIFT